MLCSVCIGVLEFRANLISDNPGDNNLGILCAHHRTVSTLAASAAEGCHICQPFWCQLTKSEQELLRYEESKAVGSMTHSERMKDNPFNWLTCMFLRPDKSSGWEYVVRLRFSAININWRNVSARRENIAKSMHILKLVANDLPRIGEISKASNTSSEDSWSTATTWLNKCLGTHAACNEHSNDLQWYPTRLLDVGDMMSDKQTVRLVYSAEESLSGRYCTLSHCWGKSVFLQLNQDTANALRSGISINQLPKTFRDAAHASKRLGVQYIWIDSLCIMQDDRSDWFREASRMHLVYSASYCNLSASASADSSQGLFRERLPHTLQATQVNLCVKGLGEKLEQAQCDIYNFYFWLHNVSHCVVNRRGWVCQERLLAPRILYFGRNQLFWECCEYSACEAYPEGLPPYYEAYSYSSFKSFDPNVFISKMDRKQKLDVTIAYYMMWNEVVETYSQASLTVSGDKLAALSGLAKRFRVILRDDYVVGMWRKHMESALLWYTNDYEDLDGTPSSRPATYRAPTWSWTSIDGFVVTDEPTSMQFLIKVEDFALHHATDDTTGVVTGGWLDLTGPLKPMQVMWWQYNWYMYTNNAVVQHPDTRIDRYSKLGPTLQFDVVARDDEAAFDADNVGQRLFFMVCRPPSADNKFLAALLLRLVDKEKTLFERIGLAFSGRAGEHEMLLAELDEETKSSLPCSRYENGLHTIRII